MDRLLYSKPDCDVIEVAARLDILDSSGSTEPYGDGEFDW